MCNSLNTFFMEKMLTNKRLQPEQIFPIAIFLPDLMAFVSFICFFHSEQVDTELTSLLKVKCKQVCRVKPQHDAMQSNRISLPNINNS